MLVSFCKLLLAYLKTLHLVLTLDTRLLEKLYFYYLIYIIVISKPENFYKICIILSIN